MKLKNKKTGEIGNLKSFNKYWYMSNNGDIRSIDYEDTDWDNKRKEIGNYFETKEEAEKAVEKLKAWKRLKDKGFRFERYLLGGEYGNTITFSNYIECDDKTRADLDLLFGGEIYTYDFYSRNQHKSEGR